MIWVENKFLKEPGARSPSGAALDEKTSFLALTKGTNTGPNS